MPSSSKEGEGDAKSQIKSSRVECEEQKMEIKSGHKRTTLLLGVYIFLQLFLPNSHFITKGYNNWTKGTFHETVEHRPNYTINSITAIEFDPKGQLLVLTELVHLVGIPIECVTKSSISFQFLFNISSQDFTATLGT